MLLNENTILVGKNTILVPYTRNHVSRYHEWMKSPSLQQQTASEPLTIEQEYQMQEQWQKDIDKLTFIINSKSCLNEPNIVLEFKEYGGMIGDVNLFFNDDDDPNAAELEIMIAEPEYRRRGHAQEACLIMMKYAATRLKTRRFVTKIGFENEGSITLFKKLGFIEKSRSQVFQEITFEKDGYIDIEFDHVIISSSN